MPFDQAMQAGRDALAAGYPALAYRQFGRAHVAGHNIRRQHFTAHRALIQAAWRGRRVDRCAQNLVQLVAAFIFDWDTKVPTT